MSLSLTLLSRAESCVGARTPCSCTLLVKHGHWSLVKLASSVPWGVPSHASPNNIVSLLLGVSKDALGSHLVI